MQILKWGVEFILEHLIHFSFFSGDENGIIKILEI